MQNSSLERVVEIDARGRLHYYGLPAGGGGGQPEIDKAYQLLPAAPEFQEILFLNTISALIVGETRNSLWNATMVRRRGARQAFTPRAGESS